MAPFLTNPFALREKRAIDHIDQALLSVHMLLTPVAVIAWAKTVAFSGFFSFVLVPWRNMAKV